MLNRSVVLVIAVLASLATQGFSYQSKSIGASLYLFVSAPPEGPTPDGTDGILLEDDKNKTTIWQNLWKYYKKSREWATTYINSLNAVSDLLYGTYSMLKKWEDISKKVAWLTSNNPFDGDGIVGKIENAESWFRTSDELFFEDVPTAMAQREMLSKQQAALIKSFREGKDPTEASLASKEYGERYREAYLRDRGIQKAPEKNGRIFLSPEEEMLQNIIKQNATGMAKLHSMSIQLQQEDAAVTAVSQDVYELVNCQDEKICGGLAQRADAENRMGMLDQRRIQLATKQAEYSTEIKLQDVLSATQVYITQGVTTTAYLGALVHFQKAFCDANGLSDEKLEMESYRWGSLYPRAYQYDGKIYGPDVHYYDLYK